MLFESISQHSCQVMYNKALKLPGTGNTFNKSFFLNVVSFKTDSILQIYAIVKSAIKYNNL